MNAALRDAANGAMKGILAYSDAELVSIASRAIRTRPSSTRHTRR